LIDDVNDTNACADELARKLKGIMCHVNLIPANPVAENTFKKPDMAKIIAFKERLIKNGINATVRRTLGADIDASCGQLRRKAKEVTPYDNKQ
jgi:23S rRNA (adenine2503-C2)-methyltransferase